MSTHAHLYIKTQSSKYILQIGSQIFLSEVNKLLEKNPNSKIAIITDSHLKECYQKQLSSFKQKNFYLFVFNAGEKQKNNQTKLSIERFLFQNKFDRSSLLIALGGGVVGDLVGYVASTFMRGVRYYQIPTSIISVVDSSVGGKTGINNEFGKNLIGTFYHPQKVIIDINFLKTLPDDEYISGLAEVLKYAFIYERKLYTYLLNNKTAILKRTPKCLFHLIKTSVIIKGKVVGRDEKEGGYRRILNFGHTIGTCFGKFISIPIKAWLCCLYRYGSGSLYFQAIGIFKRQRIFSSDRFNPTVQVTY